MASTETGSCTMRPSNVVTCATEIRLRRSATNKAFATSSGQMPGATASAPAARRSKIPSVNDADSSSKHHATVTEASSTNCLAAAFINQLFYRDFSQGCTFSNLPNTARNFPRVFPLPRSSGDQLSDRHTAQRDSDHFPLGHPSQQRVEVRLSVKSSDCCHACLQTTSLSTSPLLLQLNFCYDIPP